MVRHGKTPQQQRDRCRQCPARGPTCLLDDSYPGQSQSIKDQMVEMAMNAMVFVTRPACSTSAPHPGSRTQNKAPDLPQVNHAVLAHAEPEPIAVEISVRTNWRRLWAKRRA